MSGKLESLVSRLKSNSKVQNISVVSSNASSLAKNGDLALGTVSLEESKRSSSVKSANVRPLAEAMEVDAHSLNGEVETHQKSLCTDGHNSQQRSGLASDLEYMDCSSSSRPYTPLQLDDSQDSLPEVNPEAPESDDPQASTEIPAEFGDSALATPLPPNRTYQCTVCRDQVLYTQPDTYREHPKLKVITCKNCYKFYTNGVFTKDEDGSDNQCSWCGEGGNLLICDVCPTAFCKKCIRTNFKRGMLRKIETSTTWNCFCCDAKPLAAHMLRNVEFKKKLEKIKKKTPANSAKNRPAKHHRLPVSKTGSSSHVTSTSKAASSSHKNNEQNKPSKPDKTSMTEAVKEYTQRLEIQCNTDILESVIIEHNRFGKELMKIRNTLSKTELRPDQILQLGTYLKNEACRTILQLLDSLSPQTGERVKTASEPSVLDRCADTDRYVNDAHQGHDSMERSVSILEESDPVTLPPAASLDFDSPNDSTPNSEENAASDASPIKFYVNEASDEEQEGVSPTVSQQGKDESSTPIPAVNNEPANQIAVVKTPENRNVLDDQEAGPSGLSRRALKRLIRQQADAKSASKKQESSDSSADEEERRKLRTQRGQRGLSLSSVRCETKYTSDRNSSSAEVVSSAPEPVAERTVKESRHSNQSSTSSFEDTTINMTPSVIAFKNEADSTTHAELPSNVDLAINNDVGRKHLEVSPDRESSPLKPATSDNTELDENEQAMNMLANTLDSSSDSDSPLVTDKTTPKRKVKLTPRSPVTQADLIEASSKERRERKRQGQVSKLKPSQISSMRGMAENLLIQLKEKRQSKLQKLLADIEAKTKEEIDTESKLSKQPVVDLGIKFDPEDETAINTLVKEASKTFVTSTASSKREDNSDDFNSDVEKEIRRLSKLTVLLKNSQEKKISNEPRARSSAKGAIKKQKKKSQSEDSVESLLASIDDSESSSDQSEAEILNQSEDDDDIHVVPNETARENEEAMMQLLQCMSDSSCDSEAADDELLSNPDTDSSDQVNIIKRGKLDKHSPRARRRLHKLERIAINSSSSSDDSESDRTLKGDNSTDSDDSSLVKKKKKRPLAESSSDSTLSEGLSSKKPAKKKKKRVKLASSSSSDGEPGDHGESPTKGRKEIRKVIDDSKLHKSSKSAAKLEIERRKRIEEKQKQYNEIREEDSPIKLDKKRRLILERDSKGEPVIEVDQALVKKLKPHQIDAVQFLWDCVVETVARSNDEKDDKAGKGCILAHCMGLGKTLSVITFLHTLMCYEDKLNLKRLLVICPLNTVINWKQEVEKWTSQLEIDVDVDHLIAGKTIADRIHRLRRWFNTGGIMIIGYEMFRNLTLSKHIKKQEQKDKIKEYLVEPGPDVVICDEGHLIKNNKSGLRKAVMQMTTKRRIVLTGTPLQNNLKEYYCMVDFVKPNLLGTEREFNNRFTAPITNGQYEDSTPQDVKLMKKRAHVLHEMLAGCVQRRDYSALTKFLPPKHEYILSIRLTPLQIKLYEKYLERISSSHTGASLGTKGKLFADYQNLSRVWTHPCVLAKHKDKMNEQNFIDDCTSEATPDSSEESAVSDIDDDILIEDSEDDSKTWRPLKKKKAVSINIKQEGNGDGDSVPKAIEPASVTEESTPDYFWWKNCVDKGIDLYDITLGNKFVILMEILKKCEDIGDKVLIFSQSIYSLDLIEDFFKVIQENYSSGHGSIDSVFYPVGEMVKGKNYFRIDGSVGGKNRTKATTYFNKIQNPHAKVFLISTKAGGLGINLVGANRVIIFDASWNPSFDVQAIFRAYRFGQTKPVYVYRFLAQGTMEEKIYERQITKLSLSERVIDERQIERHYNSRNLVELYKFQPHTGDISEVPILPKDLLLADILNTHGQMIVKVMEHDSLLENQVHEGLSEEERKLAWQEYNQEKDRAERPPPVFNNMLPNPAVNAGYNHMNVSNFVLVDDRERMAILHQIRRRFPRMDDQTIKVILQDHVTKLNRTRLSEHMKRVQQMQAVFPNSYYHHGQQMNPVAQVANDRGGYAADNLRAASGYSSYNTSYQPPANYNKSLLQQPQQPRPTAANKDNAPQFITLDD